MTLLPLPYVNFSLRLYTVAKLHPTAAAIPIARTPAILSQYQDEKSEPIASE